MIPKSYLRNIPPTAKGRARFLKLKEAKERDLRNIEDGISKDQAAISASTTAIASIEQTITHSKTTLTTYRKNLDALISMRQNLQALEHDVGLGSDATEEPESLGVCNNVLQFINTSTTVENQPLDRQQSGLEDRINRLVAMKEELEHELSDWKLEKLLSESSLAHLKRCYEELNSVLDGYNVTLSARHHFPAEVWILIFQEWVIDRDSNFDHQSRPSPLILSHVCQEWRKVIRNAAILWKRVDIFPASWIPQGTMQYQKLVVQHGAHNTVEIIVDISRRWNWEAQANESAIAGRLYRPDRYRNSYLSSDSPNYCTDRSDLAQASSQTVTRPYSLVVRTKNADSQDLTRLGRIPFRSPFSLTLQSIQSISSPQLLPMIKLFEPIQKLNLDNISPPASTNPAVGPQLTHLEINMTNFSSYDLSSFLQPTLQDLRLRFRSDTALVLTRDSSTLTLPNLTTLGIEMVESPVTRLLVTPAITKLILYRSQSPPTSGEWQFASWGHLSIVKELELEDWIHEGDDFDAVAAFRNLSPSMAHVSKLKFRHCRVDGRALIEVLGDMSTLEGVGRKMDEVLLQRCTGISQDECLIVRSKVGSLKIHP